jgi:plastocyanin
MKHAAVFTTALLLAACAQADTSADTTAATPAEPQTITITAKDFSFVAPDTVNPGLTTIRFVNEGPNLHHAFLVRLNDGKTLEDFGKAMQSMKPGAPFPSWAIDAGGPNPGPIGGESSVVQDLQPGTYAVICVVDLPDRVPHVMKGMTATMIVRDAPVVAAAVPEPTVTMTLQDYSFGLSTPLTAGKHVIKVENVAVQPHELVIIRLDDGKTVEDLGKWAATYEGPPPGQTMGGVAPFARGGSIYVPVDLTPGNYVLMCFVPDVNDGKPHTEHGMVMPITVS